MNKKETKTKIKWDCKRLSKDDFDLSTNRFTPKVAGKYFLSAEVQVLIELSLYY